MNFLTAALYTCDAEESEALTGAIITEFDTDVEDARPCVKYLNKAELCETQLSGAYVKDDILYSDTVCRKVFDTSLSDYIRKEGHGDKEPIKGLIDVMLTGTRYGAAVVQNAKECMENTSLPKVLVPCSSFKVSKSSFNIYAPYKNSNGAFRTLSLVDITTEEVAPFTLAVPFEAVYVLRAFRGFDSIMAVSTMDPDSEYVYYDVTCKLNPAYTFMGEGFVNYLAFQSAFYTMGLKIADSFLTKTKYVSQEERVEQPRKQPKRNISIECGLTKTYVTKVLELLSKGADGVAEMNSMAETNDEFSSTLTWIRYISNTATELSKGKEEPCDMAAASLNILPALRKIVQRYDLELLAQRYYIAEIGRINDPFPNLLRGGGVVGQAVKGIVG